MWSSSSQAEGDDKAANQMIEVAERQIADLTEACEPILSWDGEPSPLSHFTVALKHISILTITKPIHLVVQEFVGLCKSTMRILRVR